MALSIYDWMSHFEENKEEFLRIGPSSKRNNILIICHDEAMERHRAQAFCQSISASFTFKEIPRVRDVLTLYDEIWHNNTFSNVYFAICESSQCKPCDNANELRIVLQELRRYDPVRR